MNIAPATSKPQLQQQQNQQPHQQPKKRKSEPSGDSKRKKQNTTVKTEDGKSSIPHSSGHRPVTSCTHCRQHKIKCNASENYPKPCQRCERMGLNCEIDPQFRPKKGSQIQTLRNDVDELKAKLELLHKNESFIAKALLSRRTLVSGGGASSSPSIGSPTNNEKLEKILQQANQNGNSPVQMISPVGMSRSLSDSSQIYVRPNQYPPIIAKTFLKRDPQLLQSKSVSSSPDNSSNPANSRSPELLNDSAPSNDDNGRNLPPYLQESFRGNSASPVNSKSPSSAGQTLLTESNANQPPLVTNIKTPNIKEFILGDVRLPLSKAVELHARFVHDYLPFLPILTSNSAIELYSQSQLLFWTVCLTACLSDPDPTLYNQLASLIKQLAIETCWIRTPRSTHIVQSLLILSCWPLPNQKVLDDCSYRFVGLAKNLGFQLGLHRGKFISEFSRTQVSLVNAEKWRTRTWLLVFFSEQLWASILGLPPCIQTDYLVENARLDQTLPKNFRCLVCLSIFQSKLVNIMGSSVTSPDGLMTAKNRAGSLNILIRELERLVFKLQIDDPITEMYYLYVKLLVCAFAFLPETPTEDQTKYVTIAYHSATRIVTIFSKLVEVKQLSEYPIYVRHSVTYACFTLFKLHLTPLLLDKYIDSARQSIVTVHRLFRNMLAAWKDVDNDISRTAKVLEKLNYVLITQPSIFFEGEGIIKSNRSHLSNSLFYDLVSCIHEARRRNIAVEQARLNGLPIPDFSSKSDASERIFEELPMRKMVPLPFYNQITRDNFKTISSTSPNGTTITTLVPTQTAMSNAQADAVANGLSGPTNINGIPLPLLEATGSINASPLLSKESPLPVADSKETVPTNYEKLILPIFQNNSNSDTSSLNNNETPGLCNSKAGNSNKSGKINSGIINKKVGNVGDDKSVSGDDISYIASRNPVNNTIINPINPINNLYSMESSNVNSLFDFKGNAAGQPVGSGQNVGRQSITKIANRQSVNNTRNPNQVNSESNNIEPQMGTIDTGKLRAMNNNSPNGTSSTTGRTNNSNFFGEFLQQQSNWTESTDDFLGWFDVNMSPEF